MCVSVSVYICSVKYTVQSCEDSLALKVAQCPAGIKRQFRVIGNGKMVCTAFLAAQVIEVEGRQSETFPKRDDN